MRLLLLVPLILLFACQAKDNTANNSDKPRYDYDKQYYDSLANELFGSQEIGLENTSNIDSVKVEFLDKEDFEIIISVRKFCQAISDSLGYRFKVPNYDIRDFGELAIDSQIVELDTSLYSRIWKYQDNPTNETLDIVRAQIGMSPLTIIDYHNKVDSYFKIGNRDNKYSKEKKHLIITYYVSELSEFPYSKILFRLYVDDQLKVIDYGQHRDNDKKNK